MAKSKELSVNQKAALLDSTDDGKVMTALGTLRALESRGLLTIQIMAGHIVRANSRSTQTLHDQDRAAAVHYGQLTEEGRQAVQYLRAHPDPMAVVWPEPNPSDFVLAETAPLPRAGQRKLFRADVPMNPGIREAVAATVVDALGRLAETPEAFADLIQDDVSMEEIKALLRHFALQLPGEHWDGRLEEV